MRRKKKKIDVIYDDVEYMREKIVEKRPGHFSTRDVINAFFGSLIIGITFVLKGSVLRTAIGLQLHHIILIIISTIIILAVEIYFIGYSRVKDKKRRPFWEFLTKRLITLYVIAFVTSFFIVYVLGVNNHLETFGNLLKMVVLLSMPCAIGAAIPSLMKKY